MGCGVRAVERGLKVRYLVAADRIETLYRGLADNTVGKVISGLLRNELILIDELGFAPLDDTGCQLLFRFVAAAYERRSLVGGQPLAVRGVGPFSARADHRGFPPRSAPASRGGGGHVW